MAEPRDGWSKAEIVFGAIGAIFVPLALLWFGEKYKQVEKFRAEKELQAETARADAAAEAQIRTSKAGVLTQLIDSLAGGDLHKQELAFRAVEIVMPVEAPAILNMVKSWQPQPGPGPASTPTTTAQTIEKVLEDAKDQAVRNLFHREDKGARTRAYDQITKSAWRTDIALVEQILKTADEQFDFQKGVYNAIVALRDMSREATQDQKVRDRIIAFANKAATTYPGLEADAKSMKDWIMKPRK